MSTPKAYQRGPIYAQILLVSITLLLALSLRVQAQCPVSTPSPETPPANDTKKNTDAKKSETTENGSETAKPTPTPTPSPTPFPLTINNAWVPGGGAAGLGDEIVVKVNCLKEELARQENPKNGVPAQERIDPTTFVLFLNQVEIKKLHPYAIDRNLDELHFRLRRDTDSRDAWQNFLARPKDETVSLNASVGPEGKLPLDNAKPFSLQVYSKRLFRIGAALFVAIFLGFLFAAYKTTIIRDSGPPNPVGGPLRRPYSLARTQVAWWFFIILGSFLFIGLVTQDLDTITSSSLVLLGIGTGTALGAAMVDANKRESSDSDLVTAGRVNGA